MNDKLNYKDYIHEKRMSALRTYNAIKFIGLETKEMEPKLKAHMFKCSKNVKTKIRNSTPKQ